MINDGAARVLEIAIPYMYPHQLSQITTLIHDEEELQRSSMVQPTVTLAFVSPLNLLSKVLLLHHANESVQYISHSRRCEAIRGIQEWEQTLFVGP